MRPAHANEEVRCHGCRRLIAYASLPGGNGRFWCKDAACPRFAPARMHETRDDLVFLMYLLGKGTLNELATRFDVTYQRIQQIINDRITS